MTVAESNDGRETMDRTYKLIELVGCSEKSFADAADKAVREAAKTVRGMGWFEVTELRGRIEDGKVAEYQTKLKVGFRLLRD